MKRCFLILLSFVLLFLTGATRAFAEKSPEGPVLTSLWFFLGGSMMPRSWEVRFDVDPPVILENDGEARPFGAEAAAALKQAVLDFRVSAWDGFLGSDPNVLDGEAFSLELTYADGTTIHASGENAFPEGYHAFRNGFYAILQQEKREFLAGVYRWRDKPTGAGATLTLEPDGSFLLSAEPSGAFSCTGGWTSAFDMVDLWGEDTAGNAFWISFALDGKALLYLGNA